MENNESKAQRGDLMLFMGTRPWIGDEKMMLLSCHWSLGRVTGVTPEGDVSAYRTFGSHFVSRAMPGEYTLLPAGKIDMLAIESDMNARVAKDPEANRFDLPDYAYEYLSTFMRETAHHEV